MKLRLKGLVQDSDIQMLKNEGLNSFSLDARPKSFNFLQGYKIEEIIAANSLSSFSLMFENEKQFVVESVIAGLEQQVELEFLGTTPLADLDKFSHSFVWKYHQDEKTIQIDKVANLKRIILEHSLLEQLNDQGELFGFLQIFSQLQLDVEFELQINWNTNIIESMFDYFTFSYISIEVNSLVEKSYRNIDINKIIKLIEPLNKLCTGNK